MYMYISDKAFWFHAAIMSESGVDISSEYCETRLVKGASRVFPGEWLRSVYHQRRKKRLIIRSKFNEANEACWSFLYHSF